MHTDGDEQTSQPDEHGSQLDKLFKKYPLSQLVQSVREEHS